MLSGKDVNENTKKGVSSYGGSELRTSGLQL
jgi:hypothetical protein